MGIKKNMKAKKTNKIKFDVASWNTTDEDELERRRHRGQIEKFRICKLEPPLSYFGTFEVESSQDKKYCVEIRSLSENINSCNCPDYSSNKLGTCKHIEHILHRLKKSGAKLFKTAAMQGGTRAEIFLDHRDYSIRVAWPKKIKADVRQVINTFFSPECMLLGNPILTYPALLQEISRHKFIKKYLRVSQHIDHYIDYQSSLIQKQSARAMFLGEVKKGKKTLDVMKHPLYPYQQEGMMHLAFKERGLLADEMGLGKTVQAIAACELLRRQQNISRVLVIATASLKAEWEEQIAKFTDLSSVIIQGSRTIRLQQYQTPAFFYLTNYEQIIIDGPDIQRIIAPDVIILDEAQRIKNWQTKAANAVKQLKSQYAFVLTGTPLENRIDDIYSIVQFLDPHILGPLFRFNRNFYAFDDKGKVSGYQKLDELHQRLRSVMLRRRKIDVEGQLPKRTVNNYFIGMDEEQRSRYTEYEDKVARLLAQTKSRSLYKEEFEKLQRWLACMRMICDTPFILDPKCRISPKMIELEKILNELLEDKSAKIIIFSEWERMLQLVREWAQKLHLNAAWHTGSVPQHKRRADINRFKRDPDCRLFLSTDSGSVGLNLQNANIVINLDLPWNPAKLEQRIARAWRKHQKRPVQVINLVCENSIEHRMLGLLAQKQTLAQGVLEGEGDLTNMDLPSGRSAFIERMNNLMERQPPTQDSGVILAKLDQQTLDIIQKLAEAGIITINQPSVISQASAESANAKKKLHEQQVHHAKKHLAKAERKQRMAQVLVASNFNEEAVLPLREALQSTIHSFAALIGKSEYDMKELKDLVDQYGLPGNVVSLFAKLSKAETEPHDLIKDLVAEQQAIFLHVDARVCSKEVQNANI